MYHLTLINIIFQYIFDPGLIPRTKQKKHKNWTSS